MKKLIALFILVAFGANAQTTDNIIFKISDIKPIKNAEDITIACEYNITMFNKTNQEISDVTMDLSWKDEVVSETIQKEMEASKKAVSIFARGSSRTKSYDKDAINSLASLASIPSKRQVISKQRASTNKCFLLLENPDINNVECTYADAKENASCAELVTFIDSKSPDYYTDFSEESFDDKEDKHKLETQKQIDEINMLHNKNNSELNKIISTLKTME